MEREKGNEKNYFGFAEPVMLVSLAGLSAAEETAVSREDRLSETRLTATVQRQEIEYTATAGTLAQFRRDAEAWYGAR